MLQSLSSGTSRAGGDPLPTPTPDFKLPSDALVEAVASVKSSKKKGLPGILRLVMLARLP